VRQAAQCQERHDGAIVRQAVKRSRTDNRHPMHKRGIDVFAGRKLDVRVAERVERDGKTPRR